jgi:hypothetical protein
MLKIDRKVFNENLLLTQTYCEMQLANTDKSAAEILRSFNPEYDGKPIFSFRIPSYEQYPWGQTIWNVDPLSGCHFDLYKELFEKQLRYKQGKVKKNAKEQFYQGKILAAEIDKTVVDGASESESDGLIDINDCPPIDTWCYMINDEHGIVLLAWIPDKFVELIDNAINVNCIGCLSWYDGESYFEERTSGYLRAKNYQKIKKGWLTVLMDKIKSIS